MYQYVKIITHPKFSDDPNKVYEIFFLQDYQSEGSFDTLFDMFYRNQNIYDLWLAIHDFPALIKACCIYLVDHLKGLVIFSNNKHYNGQNGKKNYT